MKTPGWAILRIILVVIMICDPVLSSAVPAAAAAIEQPAVTATAATETEGLSVQRAISVNATTGGRPERVEAAADEVACTLVGPYRNASAPVDPAVNEDGTSPNGVYQLAVSGSGTDPLQMTITETASNTLVAEFGVPFGTYWGFSPDDERFVYHYVDGGIDHVFLLNLAGPNPAQAIASFGDGMSTSGFGFSASGRYFLYARQTSTTPTALTVVETSTGATRFDTQFSATLPPKEDASSGGWGFNPNKNRDTLIYAYGSGQTSTAFFIVNLATGQTVFEDTIASTSASWRFSPCGDVLAMEHQVDVAGVPMRHLRLLRTEDGSLVTGTEQDVEFGYVRFFATLDDHRARVGDVSSSDEHTLAQNEAAACAADPTSEGCASALALSGFVLRPTAVRGGQTVEAFVTLNRQTPNDAVVELSSDNVVDLSVPPTATVSGLSASKVFAINTNVLDTESNVSVDISATYGGVTRTVTLTIRQYKLPTPTPTPVAPTATATATPTATATATPTVEQSSTPTTPEPTEPTDTPTPPEPTGCVASSEQHTFHNLDVITAQGQTIDSLTLTNIGQGPSVNEQGTIAFAAQHNGGSGLFVAEAGGCRNINPNFSKSFNRVFSDAVQVNEQGQVLARDRAAGSPPSTYARIWDSSPGAPNVYTLIASGGPVAYNPDFTTVYAYPSMNNAGQVVFTANDLSGQDVLQTGVRPAFNGPVAIPGIYLSRPQMANDGRFVIRRGDQTQPIVLDNYDFSDEKIIACGSGCAESGFSQLGRAPGISQDGKVIVFAGDRGNGPGVFASVDDGTGGRKLLRIAGENDPGTKARPELGRDKFNAPLYLNSIDIDSRVAVTHEEHGDPGFEGDRFVVTFLGTPNMPSTEGLFSAQKGLWTVNVTQGRSSVEPYDLIFGVSRPIPVLQVGDLLAGSAVTDIGVNDPLAGVPGGGRWDYQVVFWASTSSSNMIVRALPRTGDVEGVVRDGDPADKHSQPLAGLRVGLFQGDPVSTEPDPLVPNQGTVMIDTGATDASGHYSFTSIPRGWYRVRAWLEDATAYPALFEVRYTGSATESVWVERDEVAADGSPRAANADVAFSNQEGARLADSNVAKNPTPSPRDRLDDMGAIFRFARFGVDESYEITGGRGPLTDTVIFTAYENTTYSWLCDDAGSRVCLGGLPDPEFGDKIHSDYSTRSAPNLRGNGPMNDEWHEFAHLLSSRNIRSDGLSDPNDDWHNGINNSDSWPAMAEGFPIYWSMVLADRWAESQSPAVPIEERVEPEYYARFGNFERMFSQAPINEEVAVGQLLWDLYDGASDHEPFTDTNGNGRWDRKEFFVDRNNNGTWDAAEFFTDADGNNMWDDREPFVDENGNGEYDIGESFSDTNANGVWDEREPFVDSNGNGTWDAAEVFDDDNLNGGYDSGEPFVDLNADGKYGRDCYNIPVETLDGSGAALACDKIGPNSAEWVWQFLKATLPKYTKDMYFALKLALPPASVKELFLMHGLFADIDDDGAWDQGEVFSDDNGNADWDVGEPYVDANGNAKFDTETVGTAANSSNPDRQNLPPRPGAFLRLHLRDAAGNPVPNADLVVEIDYDASLELGGEVYVLNISGDADPLVQFGPPQAELPATISIRALANGALSPESLVFTSADYWSAVSTTTTGYAYEQTFTIAHQGEDGDGVSAASDNCPFTYNPDQADGNGNGVGNACEIQSFTLSQDKMAGGGAPITGTVSLTLPANQWGSVLNVRSSDPSLLTVPANIVVRPGESSAQFPIAAAEVSATTTQTITASNGRQTLSASVTVAPPPSISATLAPPANADGWNNTPVAVTWTVDDQGLGIISSSGCEPATFTADTPGTTLTCSATNGQGISTSRSVTVRVDTVPPTTTVTSRTPEPDAEGWNEGDVTIWLGGTDSPSGSGVKSITYTLSGAQTETKTIANPVASLVVTAEGTTTVTYSALDVAGNAEATHEITVNIRHPEMLPPGLEVSPRQALLISQPTLTISGGGFVPGEMIAVSGGPFANFDVYANSLGGFTTSRQAQVNYSSGHYTIVATGKVGNASYSADIYLSTFTMSTPGDNPAVAAGSSAPLTLSGTGFYLGEAVVIRSEPAGLFADANLTADGFGAFYTTVNTDTLAPAGVFQVVATGATSTFRASVPFNVIAASVTPQQLRAGEHPTLTLQASGLTPGADVAVSGAPFGGTVVAADESGQVGLEEPVIATAAGRYLIYVTDTVTGGKVGVPVYLSGITFPSNPVGSNSSQTMSAAGFVPGEVVSVSVSPPGHFADFTFSAGLAGQGSATVAGSGVPVGLYTFTATGLSSGFTATGDLRVSDYGMGVSPQQIAAPGAGVQFTLSATGFAPGEFVDISAASAFPEVVVAADAGGVLNATLRSTGGQGQIVIVAHGRSSGVDNRAKVHFTALTAGSGAGAPNTPGWGTIRGYGFLSGEPVQLTSNPPTLFTPTTTTAGSTGDFIRQMYFSGVDEGLYQIISVGQQSGYTATALHRVGRFTISPNAVASGEVVDVTFRGSGYSPNETVNITTTSGSVAFPDFALTADANGNFELTKTITGGTGTGFRATVSAIGASSGVNWGAAFYKLSLTASSVRSTFGQAPAVTYYLTGFAAYGTVHLSSLPAGLFAERDASVNYYGNVNVGVTINPAAAPGAYVVRAEDAGNGLIATLAHTVDPLAGSNPLLRLDTTPRLFNADAGSTVTATAALSLRNEGAADLNWQAAVSTADSGSWLSVDRTSGTLAAGGLDSLIVQADPSALAPGVYTGEVTVSGQEGTVDSPQLVKVTLAIRGGTTLTLVPERASAGTYPGVTITAAGFMPGEIVDVTGGPWASLAGRADSAGGIALTTQVSTSNAGRYKVTLHGRSSNLDASAFFGLTGLDVAPSAARTGRSTDVRVSGAGFGTDEGVTVTSLPAGLFTPLSPMADADGAFSLLATVSADAPAGQYQIVATGASGIVSQRAFYLSTLSLTPAQANRPVGQVAVVASGYAPGENVHVWLNPSTAAQAPVDTTLVADEVGGINATLTLAANAADDWYVAHALGAVSGVENTAPFYQTGIAFNTALVPANTASNVLLKGYGFLAGGPVNLASNPPALFAAPELVADAGGSFAVWLPVNAPAGFYHVVATGATGGYSAAADLHVGGLSVTPPWQEAGGPAPLLVEATGFAAGDVVQVGLHPSHAGAKAPFGTFGHAVDANGALSVTRPVSEMLAGHYRVDVWDSRGALESVPYSQVRASLDSPSGALGQANTLAVSGQSFGANETIQVSANDPDLFAPVTTVADGYGNFTLPVTTRATAPAGGYVLAVHGVSSGAAVSLNYQVGSLTLTPSQGLSGTRPAFEIEGSGFVPGERVTFSAGTLFGSFSLPADATGGVKTSSVVATDVPGRYVVTATGASGATQQSTFYLSGAWLTPGQVPPGYDGYLSIYGAGFGENEAVSVAVEPEGLLVSIPVAKADASGAVSAAALVDPTAPVVAYTVKLTGARTGYVVSVQVGSFYATPNQAPRGSGAEIVLRGTGFRPGGTVTLSSGPWGSASAVADSGGAFTRTVYVNPTSTAGRSSPQATDGTTTKTTTFYLTGVTLTGTGFAGIANGLLIAGAGYKEGDSVSISASPSGLFSPRTALVGANGSWTLALTTEPAAPAGVYSVSAAGNNGFTASANFTVGTSGTPSTIAVAPGNLVVDTTTTSQPVASTITLTNTTAASLTWTSSTSQTWLTRNPTSGTIGPGASQTITASVNPAGQVPATYGGTITITPGGTGANPARIGVQMNVAWGGPGLAVSPRQAPHGTRPTLTFSGSGFRPGESVSLSGGPYAAFSVTADANGAFSGTAQTWAAYDYNQWTITARGTSSGITRTALFNVTWLKPQVAGVRQGSGDPLVVDVLGWQVGETVRLTTTPPGLSGEVRAVVDPYVAIQAWSVPTDPSAPAGVYDLTATGESSGMQASIPVQVLALGVSPDTIAAGDHPLLTIAGYGFTPGGDVSIAGGPFANFVVRADDTGSVNVGEPVYSTAPGTYTLSATDAGSAASAATSISLVGISVEYSVQATGRCNKVSGGGFLPGETVSLGASPAGAMEELAVIADAAGKLVSVPFCTLATAPAGSYTLSATGNTSGRHSGVTLNLNDPSILSISPAHAPAGTQPVLTLAATGFKPGETVDFANGPFDNFATVADESGTVAASMPVGDNYQQAGAWQPSARGRGTGITAYGTYHQTAVSVENEGSIPVGFTGALLLRAAGFLPGENVTFRAMPDGLFSPLVATSDQTIVRAQVDNAAVGDYTITAIGATSGFAASVVLQVADLSVSPRQFDVGVATQVTVVGRGFQPGEVVRLNDETCHGCLFGVGLEKVADASGGYTATFLAQGLDAGDAGVHRLSARGITSDQVVYTSLYVSQLGGPGQLTAGQTEPARFTLRGFRERVAITLESSPAGLFGNRTAVTDTAGAVDVVAAVEPSALPGRYRVIATDIGSGFSVGLDILLVTPGTPVLSVDTSARAFVATVGGTSPAPQTYKLWNGGAGVLGWTASGVTDDGGTWLQANAAGSYPAGTSGYPSIAVDTTGLAAGRYTGTVIVSAPAAENAPQTIPVRLAVVAPGTVTASVTPDHGPQDVVAKLVIVGSGFDPGEAVEASSVLFATLRAFAGADGQVTFEPVISHTGTGQRTIELRGLDSALKASASYTPQSFFLDPQSTEVGETTRVYVDVYGMAPGETIEVSVEPAGLFASFNATANSSGNLSTSLYTEANAPQDTYVVRARGATSGWEQTRPFSVSAMSAHPLQWPYSAGDDLLRVTVQGSGFWPNELVDLSASNLGDYSCEPSLVTYPVQSDAAGHITASLSTPTDGCSGRFEISAWGMQSGIQAIAYVHQSDLYFWDVAKAIRLPSIPANTPTSVQLRAVGFQPGETVTLSGDTSILDGQVSGVADGLGRLYLTVPISAAPGAYTLAAHGQTSGYASPAKILWVGVAGAAPRQWQRGQSPDLTISGLGFLPGERVEISGGPFGDFAVVADAGGAINAVRRVTNLTLAQQWNLRLHGTESAADQTVKLYQTGVSLSVTSSTVGVATSTALTAQGFASGETIGAESVPAGLFNPVSGTADTTGRWYRSIATLASAPAGQYQVVLTGLASGFQASADFRVLTPGAPFLYLNKSSFTFASAEGSGAPADQLLTIGNATVNTTLRWTATVTNISGGNWLSLSSGSGTATSTASASVVLHANPSGLAAGSYLAQIVVDGEPGTTAGHQVVSAILNVGSPASGLGLSTDKIEFDTIKGQNPAPLTFLVQNLGGTTMTWSASTTTTTGGSWLSLPVATGSVEPQMSQPVTVTVASSALESGYYTGTITVEGDAATHNSPQTIAVTVQVHDPAEISISPQAITLSGQEGLDFDPSGSFTIRNYGGYPLSWTSNVSTSNGVPWLSLSPAYATLPMGGRQDVQLTADTGGLFAGTYTATVTISDPQAVNSPQVFTVTLEMAEAAPPALHLSRNGVSVIATEGGPNPVDPTVRVRNDGGKTLSWQATANTADGGNWLTVIPGSGSATAGNAEDLAIHANLAGMPVGTYSGIVTVAGAEGTTDSPQTVSVTLLVNPSPPVPLTVKIGTDKAVYAQGETMVVTGTVTLDGEPVTNAAVQARFVAPDHSTKLIELSNGGTGHVYTASIALGSSTGPAALYLTATTPDGLTDEDALGVTVSGRSITFSSNQTFPSAVKQSETGRIGLQIANDGYLAEPTTIELSDVTSAPPVLLSRSDVLVPPNALTPYNLDFAAVGLTPGIHRLRVALTRLPESEAPNAITEFTGTVTIDEAAPIMSVNPTQPKLSVVAGQAQSESIVVANHGELSLLTGIHLSLVSRSGGTPYPWLSLSHSTLPNLGYNGSASFTVSAAPPAGTVPQLYDDAAIRIDSDNGGTGWLLPLEVYVESAKHSAVIFAVLDNTGQAVTNGQVELTSMVPPYNTQSASLDANGVVTFTNLSVGTPYRYWTKAQYHEDATGYYTAQDESTHTVPVESAVNGVKATWDVVPTSIQDVYDVNLRLTYEVDTPVPQLIVDPAGFQFTKDPANPLGAMLLNNEADGSGPITIVNPSRIAVNNVVVDGSAVQGADIRFSYGAETSAKTVVIPTIPPQSSVNLRYTAAAYCSPNRLASRVDVTGQYVYFKSVPRLSLSLNNWTVDTGVSLGSTMDLTLANTGHNLASNVNVSAPQHGWVTVPRLLGDLGIGDVVPFRIVVAPPLGTTPGTYTETLTVKGGNNTPDSQIVMHITVGENGSLLIEGAYTMGDVPSSTAVVRAPLPVSLDACSEPPRVVEVPQIRITDRGFAVIYSRVGTEEDMYLGGGSPSQIPVPPAPVPMAHEAIKLEIPQRASLERQAFTAKLETTNLSGGDLQNFRVDIKVSDIAGAEANTNGQRYVDLFAITTPTEAGYGTGHAIPIGQTASSQWTLIPAPGLGGADPAGTRYNVWARYTYTLNGVELTTSTAAEEITIYPMPKLLIDYFVPRTVKANQPVKLGVVVRNVGDGPANDLTIVSGQPRITENLSNLLITFGLLGGSVNGEPVPASTLSLQFGDLPPHSQTWGYWLLSADVDGEFSSFTANYTQRTYADAVLSPLISAVHTNIIFKGNVVPSGGQALEVVAPGPDFPPDVLLDLETGISTPMLTQYITDAILATPQSPTTKYCVASIGGYVLAVVPDSLSGEPLVSVRAAYPDATTAELFDSRGLVWRGSDVEGNKVYVVDTPGAPVGANSCYEIRYPSSAVAPVATADNYSVAEDTPLSVPAPGVLANDTGGSLTATLVTGPTHGTIALNADGSFTFTPPADFNGEDAFTYKATDGTLESDVVAVTIVVTPVNDPPVATTDTVTTDEDTAVAGNVLANDGDVDGNTLTVSTGTEPSHGTVTLNPDGWFTYTPGPNFNGEDSFAYTASDGQGGSANGTVVVTVAPVNDSPVALDQTVTTDEDLALALTLVGTDVDSVFLTYDVVAGPQHGVLSGEGAALTYTPGTDYDGPDGFTFRVGDGQAYSNVATVSIAVNGLNDAPVAVGQSAITDEDTPVALTLVASDPEQQPLTYVVSAPAHGTLTGTAPNLTYTPAANYHGVDGFTFHANDGLADSNEASVSITVTPVNDQPVAADDTATTNEDTAVIGTVLLNDGDVDGDQLATALINGPPHGAVTLNLDGSFTYTPNPNYYGPDSFTYRANDGALDSNVATVSLTIFSVNDAPVANDQNVTTDEDVAIGVTLGASDPEGDSLTYTILAQPSFGSVSWTPPSVTFTPSANFSGADSFIFRVSDGADDSNLATVTITVNPVNDPPMLDPMDDKAVDEGTLLAFTARAIDVDTPAGELRFSLINAPDGATIDPISGAFAWTPDESQGPETYTFSVQVSDDGDPALSHAAPVRVLVREVNQAPSLAPGGDKTVDEETTLSFTASASDPDVPANTVTYSLDVGAPAGAVVDANTGTFTWTPAEGQGPAYYTVIIRATDNGNPSMSDSQSIIITVNEVNLRPTLSGIGNKSVVWGDALSFTAVATDADAPANTLTFSLAGAPAGASIDPANGSFTWTPTSDQISTPGLAHSFDVRVSDSGTPSLSASETITVTVGKRPTSLDYGVASSDQYSDPVTVEASLADSGAGTPGGTLLGGRTINFTLGTQTATAATDWKGLASTSIALDQAAGSISAVASFAGDAHYLGSTASSEFTVLKELADLEYTGDSLVNTASGSATSATVNLAAVLREDPDGNLGTELDKTQVRFSAYKFTDTTMTSREPTTCIGAKMSSGSGFVVVGCSVALGVDNYAVKVELLTNNYYTAPVEVQAVTVVQPGTGTTTGGGWLTEPVLGTRSNLGYTVKFLKNGRVQGNSLYIYRVTTDLSLLPSPPAGAPVGQRDYNWIIKSNAMSGLIMECSSTQPKVCTASFTGKNTITAVDRVTGVAYSLGGNYQFQVDVVDKGEPGSNPALVPDAYALRVWSATGNYYVLGSYDGTQVENDGRIPLVGGNIQVRTSP